MSSLITEGTNKITENIDIMNPEDKVNALIEVDKEMFSHLESSFADQLAEFSERVYQTLRNDGLVLYHGAGTSGRLAKHAGNEHERFHKGCLMFGNGRPLRNFKGIIAGGYPALVRSVEGAEDDAAQGAQDVLKTLEDVENALYVSITCSGGAKCNLGGLEAALMESKSGKQVDRVAILFNELEHLDNQTSIDAIGKTVQEVYEGFGGRDLIINPLLGEEAIAGSTRMKGGSMTQLILDVAYNAAIESILEGNAKLTPQTVRNFLEGYKQCITSLEDVKEQLIPVVEAATQSLRKGGNIYYLGGYYFGGLGITDASETVPTFGAPYGQVRGYMIKGWDSFVTFDEMMEMDSRTIHEHPLSLEDFAKKDLTENDLVILLGRQYPKMGVEYPLLKTFETAKDKGAKTASLIIDGHENGLGVFPQMPTEHYEFYLGYDKYVMKFLLNTISTCAYVSMGKTYGNLMIDLKLSNDKLIERGVRIINSITGQDEEHILYHLNHTTALAGKKAYGEVNHLIPTALLMMAGLDYGEAVKKLGENLSVRNVLTAYHSDNVVEFKKPD